MRVIGYLPREMRVIPYQPLLQIRAIGYQHVRHTLPTFLTIRVIPYQLSRHTLVDNLRLKEHLRCTLPTLRAIGYQPTNSFGIPLPSICRFHHGIEFGMRYQGVHHVVHSASIVHAATFLGACP